MGVKGLQSYVENECSGKASYRVSIAKTIQSFVETSSSSSMTPLILVDTSSLLRPLFEGLDWICGGQFGECAKRVKEFVVTFRNAGAEPIFFFDGPCQVQKRDEWIKRRVQNYHRVQHLMARILKGESVAETEPILMPSGLSHFVRYVVIQECKCQAITSRVECDEEIAAYARQNASKVVGIMSQDSDYIIFNAAPYYFSTKHLDMTDFTTVVYDSNQFAKIHNCDPQWLPVLGTLMGNDLLSPEVLRGFHKRITGWRKSGNPRHNLIVPAIVKIIKEKLVPEMSVEEMAKALHQEIFPRGADSETFQAVLGSLKMFMVLNEPNSGHQTNSVYLNELMEELMTHFNFHSVVAQVLVYRCVDQSNAIEDLTSEFTPTCLAFRPLNSRIYGVLLKTEQSRLGDPSYLREYAVYSEHSVKKPAQVGIIYPPFDVDLLVLARSEESEKMSKKLKLLFWMLCVDDVMSHYHSEVEKLFLRVEPKYVIPALVLFHLHKIMGIVTDTEVELFLSLILFLDVGSYDKNMMQKLCSHPNYNAVHLATLFMKGVQCVHRILSILGPIFPSVVYSNANFFDGILFQNIFCGKLKMADLKLSEREVLIRSSLRDFILTPLINPEEK